MTNHAVHWGEGLFLRPQHLQSAERHSREELRISENWGQGYPYGLQSIDIDEDALANWRVVLRTCHIRLHDGTHLRYPEDANLAALDLPKDAFDRQNTVMVHLAVPPLRLGHSNAALQAGDASVRYLVDSMEIEDENQPGNPQPVEVRWANARLIINEDELVGYESLPIMRLRRGTMAEAPPEIDPEYIPPVVTCDAWPILLHNVIDSVCQQIGSRVESQTRQMFDRNVAFESGHKEDLELIFQLHSLNTAMGYLWNLPHVVGIHPLVAYMELCRVVGLLAIFWPERRMPEVPRYDHDDLGGCFYAIKRLFTGAGQQMQVRLEQEWLQPNWTFFIGVESSLSYNEINNLLRGELNMKVGSTAKVDNIFQRGQAGVSIVPEPEAPRMLPGKNWTYWKVDERSAAWKDVADTLNLGVRINETQVDGPIQDQQDIRVRTPDGESVKMVFALYAVPAVAGS